MLKFWLKILVYLVAFVSSLYGLSALDFNRFLRKNKPAAGQVLYILIAFIMAYLLGNFLMSLIYYFNV